MPRQQRYILPGMPQHVIQRGNNRQPAFFAENDYRQYMAYLKDAADRHQCDVHAYVLMTNHVHLLMTPHDGDGIAKAMQSLGRRYVYYINHTYRRTGTLWEGRYKASLVDSEQYLLACYRYIELNPVRARMVADPADYRWSSYRAHAGSHGDELLTDHPEYKALGQTQRQRQEAYHALVAEGLAPAMVDEIRGAINQCLVLGPDRFKDAVEQQLNRRVRPGKPGRPKKPVKPHTGDAQKELPV